jgi:gas vesicle protein
MAERDEFGAFLLGFVIGGLTGAVASLLLAPQSGTQTRSMLKDKAIELGEQVSTTADDTRAKAEAVLADAKARAETITADAKVKADEIVKSAKSGAEELVKTGTVVLEEQKAKVKKAIKLEEPPAPEGEA